METGRKASVAVDKEKSSSTSSKGDTTLTVGKFSLTGASGTVESGASAKVFVTFGTQDVGNYSELLAVKISDRDVCISPEVVHNLQSLFPLTLNWSENQKLYDSRNVTAALLIQGAGHQIRNFGRKLYTRHRNQGHREHFRRTLNLTRDFNI